MAVVHYVVLPWRKWTHDKWKQVESTENGKLIQTSSKMADHKTLNLDNLDRFEIYVLRQD